MEYPDAPSASASPSPPATTTSSSSSPTMDPDADPGDSRAASPELPLTMTASAVLGSLPRDASAALRASAADGGGGGKVVVRFKAVGAAPPLRGRGDVRKISGAQRFEAVAAHLRRALRLAPADGLFLYVNSCFAPALDEVVGNLHRCFKDSNDQLVVAYSITPAFG
ncbi:ubiquitin-like autophagy protein Apg12 [Xylariomycetidae sp. FL0641]|nr:ubiquitin-like autophagy protein Apg12 [Xylariomycetidae sp. FL0641]